MSDPIMNEGLAQQLVRLCEQHGLSNLSVEVTIRGDGSFYFGSYAHARGICASATQARETPHDAISEAITALKAKLGEGLIDVPELESAA